MILPKLISLHVALPVSGVLLNILLRKFNRTTAAITLSSLLLLFCLSVAAFIFTSMTKEFSYVFGGWNVPFGIEFRINIWDCVFLILISFSALCTFFFGYRELRHNMEEARVPLFCAIFLLCVFGLYGVVLTNDFFNLYVFLEIHSLTTYALVSWNTRDKSSLLTAFYYLIVGTIAALFLLLGIGYL